VTTIVTYTHRYKPSRIVTAKPLKRRRLGVMVADPAPNQSDRPTGFPTIVRPTTAKLRRWNAMRERMGLEP
jgi:hypothetical protein